MTMVTGMWWSIPAGVVVFFIVVVGHAVVRAIKIRADLRARQVTYVARIASFVRDAPLAGEGLFHVRALEPTRLGTSDEHGDNPATAPRLASASAKLECGGVPVRFSQEGSLRVHSLSGAHRALLDTRTRGDALVRTWSFDVDAGASFYAHARMLDVGACYRDSGGAIELVAPSDAYWISDTLPTLERLPSMKMSRSLVVGNAFGSAFVSSGFVWGLGSGLFEWPAWLLVAIWMVVVGIAALVGAHTDAPDPADEESWRGGGPKL